MVPTQISSLIVDIHSLSRLNILSWNTDFMHCKVGIQIQVFYSHLHLYFMNRKLIEISLLQIKQLHLK